MSASLQPLVCSPPGSSAHGDSPGQNTGLGCHALPQGIFPTQGSNPDLLHCRQILYCLSHQESWCGSTKNTGVGSHFLLHQLHVILSNPQLLGLVSSDGLQCDFYKSLTSSFTHSLRPHGPSPARLLYPRGFSKQEYWSGLPCPPPGDLSNPGIKPRSPALQEDSLPSELPEKPKNTGVGSLSLLQGIFPTQELNWISCIAGGLSTS